MSHPTSHASNDPLLGGQSKSSTEIPSQPLSSTTQTAIKALSVMRIVVGAASLVAPRFACGLFKYPLPAEQVFFVRMIGGRDAALGELLLTAEDKGKGDGGRREIRRALWAGIGVDVIDIGSLAYAMASGYMSRTAGGLMCVCAAGMVGLGAVGLRGL